MTPGTALWTIGKISSSRHFNLKIATFNLFITTCTDKFAFVKCLFPRLFLIIRQINKNWLLVSNVNSFFKSSLYKILEWKLKTNTQFSLFSLTDQYLNRKISAQSSFSILPNHILSKVGKKYFRQFGLIIKPGNLMRCGTPKISIIHTRFGPCCCVMTGISLKLVDESSWVYSVSRLPYYWGFLAVIFYWKSSLYYFKRYSREMSI